MDGHSRKESRSLLALRRHHVLQRQHGVPRRQLRRRATHQRNVAAAGNARRHRLPQHPHRGGAAELLEFAAAEAVGERGDLEGVEVRGEVGVAEDGLEDELAAGDVREVDVEAARHAAEKGGVDVLGAVGGADDDDDGFGGVEGQPVPQLHELRLHVAVDVVLETAALAEERVDFVDEDNAWAYSPSERENGAGQLVCLADPIADNRRRAEVDERRAALLRHRPRQRCFSRARRAVQKNALGRADEVAHPVAAQEELRVLDGVQHKLSELLLDLQQPPYRLEAPRKVAGEGDF
mmetsp:Transcript_12816/g.32458  ORF Transcript_12816/g.32458 Transcript_12816/m.32458 type:complete len:293 (+) Transcript_12816:154-1032(+)